MTAEGIVQNGVVIFRPGNIFPEGTWVEIVAKPAEIAKPPEPSLASLLRFAGVVKDLPSDMAENHDHYLHGAPKK